MFNTNNDNFSIHNIKFKIIDFTEYLNILRNENFDRRKNYILIIHNYKLLKLNHNIILNNNDISRYIASFI
jgi:hypothetical protein